MNTKNEQFAKILSILPSIQKINVKNEIDYYGVSYLIAKKLNLLFIPRSDARWKHGWFVSDLKYPEQLTTGGIVSRYLVTLKEHEDFLKKSGMNAKAVGIPFVYMEDFETAKIDRVKNSLLVMPPHSLSYTNHNWDEETYAREINTLQNDFDLIVVCIHQSCVAKRLWIDAFEKYNIPWIVGADAEDKNSLIRMYRLFNSFEYMTTNAIGSHVAYAAYCSCKVSIFGNYAEYNKEDYKDDPFFNRFPFLLEHSMKYSSQKYIAKNFSFLFSHPKKAKMRVRWAEKELGKKNKVSLEEFKQLLGWNYFDQIVPIYKKIVNKVSKYVIKNKS